MYLLLTSNIIIFDNSAIILLLLALNLLKIITYPSYSRVCDCCYYGYEALQDWASMWVSQRWTNFCSMIWKGIGTMSGMWTKPRHTACRIFKQKLGHIIWCFFLSGSRLSQKKQQNSFPIWWVSRLLRHIQNTDNPKPEELESWNFERMFIPHYVSSVTCHVSLVTCHVSCVTCQVSHVTCHV